MTAAADVIYLNVEGHTLTAPDQTFEALAIRDGMIVKLGRAYEVRFLRGVDTTVIDCNGGVLLPGFIDAHTHMETLGRRLVHADLSTATNREAALELLASQQDDESEWILGYGYDESIWPDGRYLMREELDSISTDQPVVAFREDMHAASVNSVVLETVDIPGEYLDEDTGHKTGVVFEDGVGILSQASAPDRSDTKNLITAAITHAHRHGVTAVHDMVRNSYAPRIYRELDEANELDLRVRLYYWATHIDAIEEVGLCTNSGNEFVQFGGIKSFTDGSIGARTAKLSSTYADADTTGEWVVCPSELSSRVDRVKSLDLQMAVHAIGDEAIDETLGILPDDPAARHRIEHFELHPSDLSDVMCIASVQPNFLRWAREDGLYPTRLGKDRSEQSNQYRRIIDADIPLAFGSDCMPFGPLFGIQQAVTAPSSSQRLSVTEALRAYTIGGAYAGFDENRIGTLTVGKRADMTVLATSPWDVDPSDIDAIEVMMTIVDGSVVYQNPDGTEIVH